MPAPIPTASHERCFMTSEWAMLIGLGAFHGINPGMGWLFAVALGMQERRRGAVVRALVPLGVGHALAVAGAVGAALAIGAVIPLAWLRWPIAGVLISLGVASAVSSPAPALGGHACEYEWARGVVVPDGHRPRRRAHGGTGVRGDVDGGLRAGTRITWRQPRLASESRSSPPACTLWAIWLSPRSPHCWCSRSSAWGSCAAPG